MAVTPEIRYCTFIDLLGYKAIVESETKSLNDKVRILESIYMNLFNTISPQLKFIREKQNDDEKLFVKSASDSIYIESKDPIVLLFALGYIYGCAFGYNSNLSHETEYTPLLRSGTVKDWVLRFMDIGSLVRQPADVMFKNDDFNNPVGLGVARSYLTSEHTGLSGMRAIISPEVFRDLKATEYKGVNFECYVLECENYLKHDSLPKTQNKVKLFLVPVMGKDSKGNEIPLYELCWPVFTYTWSKNNSDIGTLINEFKRIRVNFGEREMKHYKSTAKLLSKSLAVTYSLYPEYQTESVQKVISALDQIAEAN